jgi:hypothetical protein
MNSVIIDGLQPAVLNGKEGEKVEFAVSNALVCVDVEFGPMLGQCGPKSGVKRNADWMLQESEDKDLSFYTGNNRMMKESRVYYKVPVSENPPASEKPPVSDKVPDSAKLADFNPKRVKAYAAFMDLAAQGVREDAVRPSLCSFGTLWLRKPSGIKSELNFNTWDVSQVTRVNLVLGIDVAIEDNQGSSEHA